MEKKSEIAKAVVSVMQQVKGMEKNSKVGTGNYAYDGTKDQDVKEVFNKALAENGLCILPIGIEEKTKLDRWEEEDSWSKSMPKAKKSKQSIFTKVKTKYLLLHISGESIELAGYGQGVDTQDKGAGKATTYALKNCLLLTFLTPVGKIDDTDNTHSNDISTPDKTNEETTKNLLEIKKLCNELSPKKMENMDMMWAFVKEVTKSETKDTNEIIDMLSIIKDQKNESA